MLSKEEKVIIRVLKKLKIDQDTIIGIMLKVKDNKQYQNSLIEYLRTLNYTATRTMVLQKVREITGGPAV